MAEHHSEFHAPEGYRRIKGMTFVNGVRGKGEYGHAVPILGRPPAAFCLLCRCGQSRSPPAGGEISLRKIHQRPDEGIAPYKNMSKESGENGAGGHMGPPLQKQRNKWEKERRAESPRPTKKETTPRPQAAKYPREMGKDGGGGKPPPYKRGRDLQSSEISR